MIANNNQRNIFSAICSWPVFCSLKPQGVLYHGSIEAIGAIPQCAGLREKTIATGCNGYIEKQINPETFAAEIESYPSDAREERQQ
jgi:hypothetical protein